MQAGGGPGEVGPEGALYVTLGSCGERPCRPVLRSQVFALLVTCLSQGECILPCVFTTWEIFIVERDQNLNARDGAFGRSKVERGEWFREKSVSTADMQPSSWAYSGTTHGPPSQLQGLAPTAHGVGSAGSTAAHKEVLGDVSTMGCRFQSPSQACLLSPPTCLKQARVGSG